MSYTHFDLKGLPAQLPELPIEHHYACEDGLMERPTMGNTILVSDYIVKDYLRFIADYSTLTQADINELDPDPEVAMGIYRSLYKPVPIAYDMISMPPLNQAYIYVWPNYINAFSLTLPEDTTIFVRTFFFTNPRRLIADKMVITGIYRFHQKPGLLEIDRIPLDRVVLDNDSSVPVEVLITTEHEITDNVTADGGLNPDNYETSSYSTTELVLIPANDNLIKQWPLPRRELKYTNAYWEAQEGLWGLGMEVFIEERYIITLELTT